MDKLAEINQEFNNSLDDSFSLTKIFKKDSLLNKAVLSILMASVFSGAFSFLKNTDDAYKNQVLIEKAQDVFSDVDTITSENIKSIANNNETKVLKLSNGKLVVVVHNQELKDLEKNKIVNELTDLNNINGDVSKIYASNGANIRVFRDSPLRNIKNMSFDRYDGQDLGYIYLKGIDGIKNQGFYNHLKSFEYEHIFNHELNHLSPLMSEDNIKAQDFDLNILKTTKLFSEMSADMFSLMTIIKTNDLNKKEALDVLYDVIHFRTDNLVYHSDYEHATQSMLYSFSNMIAEDPNFIENLKKLSLEDYDQIAFNYAKPHFNKLIEKMNEKFDPKTDVNLEAFKTETLLNFEMKDKDKKEINEDFKADLEIFVQKAENKKNLEMLRNQMSDLMEDRPSLNQNTQKLKNT